MVPSLPLVEPPSLTLENGCPTSGAGDDGDGCCCDDDDGGEYDYDVHVGGDEFCCGYRL